MKTEEVYWKGKCELCKYSYDFSTHFGISWDCTRDGEPKSMREVTDCSNGIYYPRPGSIECRIKKL
jgi:hypothetical protein